MEHGYVIPPHSIRFRCNQLFVPYIHVPDNGSKKLIHVCIVYNTFKIKTKWSQCTTHTHTNIYIYIFIALSLYIYIYIYIRGMRNICICLWLLKQHTFGHQTNWSDVPNKLLPSISTISPTPSQLERGNLNEKHPWYIIVLNYLYKTFSYIPNTADCWNRWSEQGSLSSIQSLSRGRMTERIDTTWFWFNSVDDWYRQ